MLEGTVRNDGDRLRISVELVSTRSGYRLRGILVLYQGGTALWATGTNGKAPTKAVMQTDGNFVLYNAANQALWATHTSDNPGCYVRVQDDGNRVLYDPSNRVLWASNTGGSLRATTLHRIPTDDAGHGVVYLVLLRGSNDRSNHFTPIIHRRPMAEVASRGAERTLDGPRIGAFRVGHQKELDRLFESNHGCGLNVSSPGSFPGLRRKTNAVVNRTAIRVFLAKIARNQRVTEINISDNRALAGTPGTGSVGRPRP